jgi:hypothetical protein
MKSPSDPFSPSGGHPVDTASSRRQWLARSAHGFGGLALLSMLGPRAAAAQPRDVAPSGRGGVLQAPHHRPRAKSVIFCYMDGGPSQVDTFDPKPRLAAEDGKPFGMKMEPTQFNNNGGTLASPWKFTPRGECGTPVSALFPHIGSCMDDIAVIRSMVADFSEHTNGNYFLHTGHGLQGRPSMGAWTSYGLGTPNRDLPAFVVLNGGLIPPGGLDCFNSGFLPASHQGSIFKAGEHPVANILPREQSAALQRAKLDLIGALDREVVAQVGRDDGIESAIVNYELAARMQLAVPELMDIESESPVTRRMYGLEHEFAPTRIYARQCLVARRLVERGVPFVELTCPRVRADRWDQHGDLKNGHEFNARSVDQPIAALLKDLKGRGLLDQTLVVFAGEFGRTPFAQGRNGRDHNPFGFSIWMAGGGIKGGVVHGATDEYGYKAVEDRVTVHDLHATMLHLLGVDHERLTYRFSGRDIRLTDVYGEVVRPILA